MSYYYSLEFWKKRQVEEQRIERTLYIYPQNLMLCYFVFFSGHGSQFS